MAVTTTVAMAAPAKAEAVTSAGCTTPKAMAVTAPTAAPPTAASKEEQPPLDGRGKHVLVVEDNPVNRRLTELLLARLLFEVTCVQNGKEAVDWLAGNRVDLVLMDCQMPVMDGYEATARIRSLPPGRREVPIWAVTAHVQQSDRQRCAQAGMDGYLPKPVSPEQLADLLCSISERQTATKRSAASIL
jgi:CheY-like chemotaxis protein